MLDIAKQLLAGTWYYDVDNRCLTHTLGNSNSLHTYNIIMQENYLDSSFKSAVRETLGATFLSDVIGPFGDDDIFSGVDQDDGSTTYFIKCYRINENKVNLLVNQTHFDVVLQTRPNNAHPTQQ